MAYKNRFEARQGRNPAMRRVIMFSVMLALATFAFFWFFPGLGNTVTFVEMAPVIHNGKPIVVSLWSETRYDEDNGLYLKGYQLQAYDPPQAKLLSKIFLPRELTFKPADPSLSIAPNGDIWIIRGTQFQNDTTGELRRLRLMPDGILQVQPLGLLEGYQAMNGGWGPGLQVRNRYNENYCYDMERVSLAPGYCAWDQPKPRGRFFMVPKAAGSTRSHLWYVLSEKPAPPAEITISFEVAEQQALAASILLELDMHTNSMVEERLAAYQAAAEEAGIQLRQVSGADYWENAALLTQDSTVAIVQLPGANPEEYDVCAIDLHGKERWRVTIKGKRVDYASVTLRTMAGTNVVCDPRNWILAVDQKTDQVLWQYLHTADGQ